jgi:hypothetical protein
MDRIGRAFYMRPKDPLHWLISGWKWPPENFRIQLRTVLCKDDWLVVTDGTMLKAVLLDMTKLAKMDNGLYIVEKSGRYRWMHKVSDNLTLWPKWDQIFDSENTYHVFNVKSEFLKDDVELSAANLNHYISTLDGIYPFIHPRIIKTALKPAWNILELWVPRLFYLDGLRNRPFLLLGKDKIVAMMPMEHSVNETLQYFEKRSGSEVAGINTIP